MSSLRRTLLPLSAEQIDALFRNSYPASKRNTFARRLNKLADLLQAIPDRQFDFSVWFRECGTIGCALGHAVANRRLFPKLGIKFSRTPNISGFYDLEPTNLSLQGEADNYFGPGAYSYAFIPGGYQYFDPHLREVFSFHDAKITKRMAIKRLRELANLWIEED